MAYHGTSDEDSRLSRMLQEQERRWEQSRFATMDTPDEVKQDRLNTQGILYCLADATAAARYQLARVRWSDERVAFVNHIIADLQRMRDELKSTPLLDGGPDIQ